jgi:inhibitor of growth protein 3
MVGYERRLGQAETDVMLVANLPAEIQHLMEEIQAKDKVIQECRNEIDSKDASLQKYIKEHGSLQKHPKEDAYTKAIQQRYDQAIRLQSDKQKLADRAMYLVRHRWLDCLAGIIY